MPAPILNINDVPQAIQLALGPAFLLTGIAGLLNVLAHRLARIVDRGRMLANTNAGPEPLPDAVRRELQQLDHRRRFASAAIVACTLAALLICMVIASLFLEVFLGMPLRWLVGILFMAATLVLVVGLGYFLREVHTATAALRHSTSRWRQ